MKEDRATRTWMFIFTGCFFIVTWLLSFTPQVAEIELRYYQQLIDLTPSQEAVSGLDPFYLSRYAAQYVLLGTFGLILIQLLLFTREGLGPTFAILVVFSLFMTQLLLAVFNQRWLPGVWAVFSFVVCSLILHLWVNSASIRRFMFPKPECSVALIRRLMSRNQFGDAVELIQECPFNDSLYDIAYELGVQLEREGNPLLAREVYLWLTHYDPAIQEFVDRIDNLDPELSLYDGEIQPNAESEDPDISPDQFGHFRLQERKARGATATVYQAHDLHTHKDVALKIFNQPIEDAHGERDIMGFLREAITVSALEHPNIVKIHDADVLGGRAYIAMDFIDGYPMSERVRRKKLLTAAESLRIMRSVLSALVLAQQKGITHGDIKPANIMYDKDRDLYIITDFGAAFSHYRGPASKGKREDRKIIGTPAYMSPEQLSGSRADGRSDLFSLGVTIYHLLSGIQPFQSDQLSEIKHKVLNQEVDLEHLSVPDSIRQILRKALEKKPYRRFADASQMLHSVLYCQQKLLNKKIPADS